MWVPPNNKIWLNIFKNIYIQPAAGDAGGALGAALAANYIYFEQERKVEKDKIDSMLGSYLGPEFSDLDVKLMAKKYNAPFTHFSDFKELSDKTDSIEEILALNDISLNLYFKTIQVFPYSMLIIFVFLSEFGKYFQFPNKSKFEFPADGWHSNCVSTLALQSSFPLHHCMYFLPLQNVIRNKLRV